MHVLAVPHSLSTQLVIGVAAAHALRHFKVAFLVAMSLQTRGCNGDDQYHVWAWRGIFSNAYDMYKPQVRVTGTCRFMDQAT
jgi:hypothetical protein